MTNTTKKTINVKATVSVDEVLAKLKELDNETKNNPQEVVVAMVKMFGGDVSSDMISAISSAMMVTGSLDKEMEDAEEESRGLFGKEFYGEIYDPYLYPNHVYRLFLECMRKAYWKNGDFNVDKILKETYSREWSIEYTKKMIDKMAELETKSYAAYLEAREIFSLEECKDILIENIDATLDVLNQVMSPDYFPDYTAIVTQHLNVGKWMKVGTVKEVIRRDKRSPYVGTSSVPTNELLDYIGHLKILKYVIRNACPTYKELSNFVSDRYNVNGILNTGYNNNKKNTEMSKVFLTCFKKRGAYYTLKSLIAFGHLPLANGLSGKKALNHIRRLLLNETEGYQFYAMLKEMPTVTNVIIKNVNTGINGRYYTKFTPMMFGCTKIDGGYAY